MNGFSRRRLCQALAFSPLLISTSSWADATDEVVKRSRRLPARPQRIVALEFAFVEMLLQMGLVPVGMPEPKRYKQWIGVDAEALVEVVDVGTRQQPNLEAIALLKPDLIIGLDYRHLSLFDTLESIAPTLMMRYAPGAEGKTQLEHTRDGFVALGELLHQQTKVAAEIERFNQQLSHDRTALEPLHGRPVSVMHNLGLGQMFWAYAGNSMAAGLAQQLDLKFWPAERPADGMQYVGVDQLIEQPDLRLVLIDFHTPDPARTLSDPLWQLVPANQNGHLALIGPNIWGFGGLASAAKLSTMLKEQLIKMT